MLLKPGFSIPFRPDVQHLMGITSVLWHITVSDSILLYTPLDFYSVRKCIYGIMKIEFAIETSLQSTPSAKCNLLTWSLQEGLRGCGV